MLRRCTLIAGAGLLVLATTAIPAFAQPKPNKGQCVSELARAGFIGRGSNPGQANIIVGTEGDDEFDEGQFTDGVDLVCGFGGNDVVPLDEDEFETPLGDGDVFLGGDGNDSVPFLVTGATFIGGAGDDSGGNIFGGTFNGGAGDDSVNAIFEGTFNGGPGSDSAGNIFGGTFNGGAGDDSVDGMFEGTFNGGPGDDRVATVFGGTFNGGPGNDTVGFQAGGTFNQD